MATSTHTLDHTGRDTLRWYTRARRIPRLVGKLPGSERGIPGGPYTMTQAIGAVCVALGLLKTEPLWGQFGWVSNKVIVLVATAGTAFLLRLIKPGGRDPLSALTALLGVATASRHGRLRGRQLRAGRPVQVHARVRVVTAVLSTSAVPPARPAEAAPPPAPRPVLEPAPALGVRAAHPPGPVRPPVRPIPALAGSLPRTNLERLLLQAQEG